MKDASIDIVIPNYNGVRFLKTCLDSIRSQDFGDWQVFLVDNGSQDGSVNFVRSYYPEVQILALEKNTGFSPAVNLGIQAGRAPFVFLLNNDTELDANCLTCLFSAARQVDADFFAAKMLSYKKRHLLDGAGEGFFRGGAGYRLGTMEEDGPLYNAPRQVFGACGGAAFYRRRVIEEVGLFDANFFAYLEDVDWNLRAARMSKSCYYVPSARVYHIGSATTGSKFNETTIRLSTRNLFFVLAKNYSLGMLLRYGLFIAIFQSFWLLFILKKRQASPYVRGIIEAALGWRSMRKKFLAGRELIGEDTSLLRAQLRRAEDEAVSSIMQRRKALGKGNALLNLYKRLFL